MKTKKFKYFSLFGMVILLLTNSCQKENAELNNQETSITKGFDQDVEYSMSKILPFLRPCNQIGEEQYCVILLSNEDCRLAEKSDLLKRKFGSMVLQRMDSEKDSEEEVKEVNLSLKICNAIVRDKKVDTDFGSEVLEVIYPKKRTLTDQEIQRQVRKIVDKRKSLFGSSDITLELETILKSYKKAITTTPREDRCLFESIGRRKTRVLN